MKGPGTDLLSRPLAQPVSSALAGLTSVFGMGTGVSPPLWAPDPFNLLGYDSGMSA